MGVDLALDTVDTAAEVEVDELLLPVVEDDACVFTEPIVPSTCGLGAGLEGSVVGLGAFGIKSYKVPDYE